MKKLFGLHAFIIFILVACTTTSPTATEVPQVVESITWTSIPTRTPIPPPTRRVGAPQTSIVDAPTQIPSLTPAKLSGWHLVSAQTDTVTFVDALGKTWAFSYSKYYGHDIKPCTYLLGQTPSEDYLYFSLGTDCSGQERIRHSISVFRINLSDGSVTETLAAKLTDFTNVNSFYSVSISSDARYLVYIDGLKTISTDKTPLTLHLTNLRSGEKTSLDLGNEYYDAGNFYWNRANDKFIVFLSKYDSPHLISIRVVDLKDTTNNTTFVQDESTAWKIVDFTDDEIQLVDPKNNTRIYSLKNDRFITSSTPTP